jgi:hypothetical protein
MLYSVLYNNHRIRTQTNARWVFADGAFEIMAGKDTRDAYLNSSHKKLNPNLSSHEEAANPNQGHNQ